MQAAVRGRGRARRAARPQDGLGGGGGAPPPPPPGGGGPRGGGGGGGGGGGPPRSARGGGRAVGAVLLLGFAQCAPPGQQKSRPGIAAEAGV